MLPLASFAKLMNEYVQSHPLQLKPCEVAFTLIPIGIRYTCEFCKQGEMKVILNNHLAPTIGGEPHSMADNHECTSCKKQMYLPRMYPYIEYVPGRDIASYIEEGDK